MMKSCLILVVIILAVDCKPSGYGFAHRPRRDYYSPQHAMMFSGFYGSPSNSYGHQGSMSAFANKDMIFTNSFAGDELPIYFPNRAQGTIEGSGSELATEEEQEVSAVPQVPEPQPPKKTQKKNKNKRKPVVTTTAQPIEEIIEHDDEDDVEEDEEEQIQEVPSRGAAQKPGKVPTPNTYFPIVFGQGGNGGHPGAAVAIANAFSTGKGGVASSHATAYGDPYFSTLNRSQNKNKRGNRNTNRTN